VTSAPEVLALVPARGGSKGIPRKNIRRFAGHPLIAYSIAAGANSRTVTRAVVSTDDQEIAGVAKEYGAEVPFLRPPELAGDEVADLPVFEHALDWLWENERYRPDVVVHLRPTSPLRPRGCVDRGVGELLARPEADSVRAVVCAGQNPFKMWTIEDESSELRPLIGTTGDELYNRPRQLLPQVYWQTGVLDAVRVRAITELHSMTGRRILPLVTDGRFAVDLDSLEQWEHAERALARLRGEVELPGPGSMEAIRLVIFDFDGVLTDNRVFVTQDGREAVASNRSDGMGISMLLAAGIDAVVVTSEMNPVAAARCRKLGIECVQTLDKAAAVAGILRDRGLAAELVAFVGNDLNDLQAMRRVGWPVAVADAQDEVVRAARVVLTKEGGRGAARELCDLVLSWTEGRPQ
jgi:YrbI family 3-deoxy-D-manno-octulosonate 8-phosphate phosphatase